MPSLNHTHKYERITLGTKNTYEVFRCGFPDCSHYVERTLGYGKKTICWACGSEFVLTKKNRTRKPTCGCTSSKKRKLPEAVPRITENQEAILETLNSLINKG